MRAKKVCAERKRLPFYKAARMAGDSPPEEEVPATQPLLPSHRAGIVCDNIAGVRFGCVVVLNCQAIVSVCFPQQ